METDFTQEMESQNHQSSSNRYTSTKDENLVLTLTNRSIAS